MGFQEGHNKIGGREKGTPNKLSKEFRLLIKSILFNELERVPEYLDSLDPKERLDIIIKLLNFAIPKIKPIQSSLGEPLDWDPLN